MTKPSSRIEQFTQRAKQKKLTEKEVLQLSGMPNVCGIRDERLKLLMDNGFIEDYDLDKKTFTHKGKKHPL